MNGRDCCHVGQFLRKARERATDPVVIAKLVKVEIDHAWAIHLTEKPTP